MDESSFEQIFKLHYAYLCNIAYTVIKDKDEAKDVVQHVFLKIWQNKTAIQQSPKSYLHRAVINAAINHLEKQRHMVDIHENEGVIAIDGHKEDVDISKLTNFVAREVQKLPPKCQAVFSLSRYEGLSNKEIADYMDISVKTVENQMGKALKTLREVAKEKGGLDLLRLVSLVLGLIYGFYKF